jgi:RNA polymerase sigma-70 factor (ECF subfamily)
MPEHTDRRAGGIGRPANPSEAGARKNDVWDASDEALVAGLVVRDADAALAFVRRFQRRVFGCAFAIVGDAGRAEDVAQEAFVRAWRHAAVFDGRRASVSTWLLTITRNLAIDAVRVERVRPADPVDLIDLTLADPSAGPAEMATRATEVERVTSALLRLPVDQRRAVVLASVHGRTAQEISEIEDIPLGTAKTRLRTGLLKLRVELVPEVAP